MNTFNALSDFLFDKKYFIALFEDKIYVYRYLDLDVLKESNIVLKMEGFSLHIKGTGLSISKLNKEEMIIKGNILEVKKEYE